MSREYIDYHVTVIASSNDYSLFLKSKRRSVVQLGNQSLLVRGVPVLLYA